VRVENSLEGTIAYAVEHDGVPLGLLVSYLYELPSVWWTYARPTRDARLTALKGSPFARPQEAVDAVDRALMLQAVKAVAA
jgi:hypothetical protein